MEAQNGSKDWTRKDLRQAHNDWANTLTTTQYAVCHGVCASDPIPSDV
jgi:hypothetical protein